MASTSQKHAERMPDICFCEEKHRMSQVFLETIRDLVDLQNEQTAALIAGDPEFSRFELLLHVANERKDQAKYDLLTHMEAHRC